MRLLKLVIENYKCFKGPTEIDFTAGRVEPGRNIFLIGGMNGAGKTAIMEAINICLYGAKKTVIHERINDNQRNKQNARCSIELCFETDGAVEWTVKRSWVSHGLFPPPSANQLNENLAVVVGGKKTSGMSESRWADIRDTIIPKTAAQFFFFDGEKIQEMMADERSEQTLKDSMEAVLGIAVIRKLIKDMKNILKEERDNRPPTSEKDINVERKQLEALEAKLAKKTELIEQARDDINEFQSELVALDKTFNDKFSPDQKSQEKRDKLRRQEARLESRRHEIDKEIKEYAEHTLPLSLLIGYFPELRRQLDAERRVVRSAAVQDEADSLATAIVEATARPETVCCHREMSHSAREELRNRVLAVLRGLPDEAEQSGKPLELFQLSAADATRVSDRLAEIERDGPSRFNSLLMEKEDIASKLENIKEEVRKASIADSDKNDFTKLQSDIKSYSAQLSRRSDERSRLIDEHRKIEEQIEDQQRKLDTLYRDFAATKEHKAFITRSQTLINLLNEYLDLVRKSKVATLQERTFEMYRRLASKSDLIRSVEIDSESYRIAIRNVMGHDVAKHNLSAGEKEVFAISLLWGLAQTSELKLPVVIDTPLSRLDSMHRDRIVADYFPNAATQVIVLSTDTEVDRSYFSRLEPDLQNTISLQFDKARKLTTIEEGYFWEQPYG